MVVKVSDRRTNNSVERANSRYVQGGDTTRFEERLGWWERRPLPFRDDDITITVQSDEERRPDVIAHNIYDKASLAWLVLQYNSIVDPETELTAGTTLRVPDPRRVQLDILSGQTGGVRRNNRG